ncbi:MAG: glycosyl transferase [Microbacterium sp. SCN 70-200]|uniref:glycosyltransferase n=2 Tax=Microbacterium TaxID=33882 RepID=UPI00086D48C3|nr:glycosyltransferase [Microbacterium sp.]MBN9216079.1 glycosyltransferase family 1 protein [Microbacterium sp.]ODT40296.1 MAG: glycosyl transferase [Microbacterium sp. SCN 70-200]OJV82071.1 MAG: glycosyl transferase [Microbacterium sp. 70-16]
MLSILICCTPVHGHVAPSLAVARGLVAAGHDVRFLTGVRYRSAVEAVGARWLPLPVEADYDDRDMDASFPGRVGLTGVAGARWDLLHIFLEPAAAQLRAVDDALAVQQADVVLAESMFLGAMLLLCRPADERPRVAGLGIVPLGLRSRDTAPFALGIPPLPGPIGRLRNRMMAWSTDRFVFAELQREGERLARELVGHPLRSPVMDYPSTADAIIQLTVPEFEYPRSDLRVPVHFVGPVATTPAPAGDLPAWWDDLADGRPVIHVTQGTVANADLDDLIMPTMRALADRDVLVVASTGGREIPADALPANARIAPYLPYDRLFPLLAGFVTNGGYGGVHFALAHGVPIVATGNTEDKSEVSARVAWSGAGVRLQPKHGAIAPDAIARAVDRILAEPSYRTHAARLGTAIAAAPGMPGIDEVLRGLVAARAL